MSVLQVTAILERRSAEKVGESHEYAGSAEGRRAHVVVNRVEALTPYTAYTVSAC
jgi:hypothetical protein